MSAEEAARKGGLFQLTVDSGQWTVKGELTIDNGQLLCLRRI